MLQYPAVLENQSAQNLMHFQIYEAVSFHQLQSVDARRSQMCKLTDILRLVQRFSGSISRKRWNASIHDLLQLDSLSCSGEGERFSSRSVVLEICHQKSWIDNCRNVRADKSPSRP
jgi:hypothetical protein